VESNLSEGIAFQIRATREAQNMTQAELASAIGMSQNNLSRLENPEYGKQTISSLKRIAEYLDVAVVVRFIPFSQYVDWISGTEYLDRGLRPEALAVRTYEEEERTGALERSIRYWPVLDGKQDDARQLQPVRDYDAGRGIGFYAEQKFEAPAKGMGAEPYPMGGLTSQPEQDQMRAS